MSGSCDFPQYTKHSPSQQCKRAANCISLGQRLLSVHFPILKPYIFSTSIFLSFYFKCEYKCALTGDYAESFSQQINRLCRDEANALLLLQGRHCHFRENLRWPIYDIFLFHFVIFFFRFPPGKKTFHLGWKHSSPEWKGFHVDGMVSARLTRFPLGWTVVKSLALFSSFCHTDEPQHVDVNMYITWDFTGVQPGGNLFTRVRSVSTQVKRSFQTSWKLTIRPNERSMPEVGLINGFG